MEVSKEKVQNTHGCLQYSILQSGRTAAVICHTLPAVIFSFCNSVWQNTAAVQRKAALVTLLEKCRFDCLKKHCPDFPLLLFDGNCIVKWGCD